MRRGPVVALALLCGAIGCSTKAVQKAPPTPDFPEAIATPVVVPTVPPSTPVPPGGGAALPTRPVKNPKAEAEKKRGKQIGPIVTFAGAARADGYRIEPDGKNAQGYPIYINPVGSGFMIVVEGKPGISNLETGRSIFHHDPSDPTARPDLEIQVTRALGDGSAEVCDARKPKIGGIPAINPPSFAEKPRVSATINDLSCRFETFIESNASCTVDASGDFSFLNPKNSKVQFCMVVARSWAFQDGDTLVSVRLRDIEGNPGPVEHFVLRRKRVVPTPMLKRALPTPTATAPRRRP
jgi:hypothetical protein